MTDKELLEQAAKAAGINFIYMNNAIVINPEPNKFLVWNPLTNDGDALRLAVKLKMVIEFYGTYVYAYYALSDKTFQEKYQDDPYAAARRAIVKAAAEIGKTL